MNRSAGLDRCISVAESPIAELEREDTRSFLSRVRASRAEGSPAARIALSIRRQPVPSRHAHPSPDGRGGRDVLRELPARQHPGHGAPGPGPRRGASPRLHPDPHRRGRTSATSTCSSAASACTCSSTCRCCAGRPRSSTSCGTSRPSSRPPPVVASPPRAKDLGELTVSTLRGEEGFQAKEIRKLVRYLEGLPPFDLVVIPNGLLISLAAPLKRALGRPVVCTLQGEDLFLEGLSEAHRKESLALMARHAPSVDAFIATSGYYADFMAELPRPPARTDPRRAPRDPPGRLRLRAARGERDPSPSATSPAWPRRRASTCWPRRTSLLRKELGLGNGAARGRRLPGARASRLPRLRGRDARAGGPARASSATTARWTARPSWPSCARSTCSRSRAPTPSRRASTCSRPWRPACPGCSPGTAPSRRSTRRRAAACSSSPTNARSLAEQLLSLARDRGLARELGRRGALGVRRHYTAARMAERLARGLREGHRPFVAPRGPARDGLNGVTPLLEVKAVAKSYDTPRGPLAVLEGVDLRLAPGQSLCVVGPSGCGKSTLLNILGALEPPTSGEVVLFGRNPFALAENDLAAFRNREVGFVFQEHHLLPQCSVLENVLVPTLVAKGRQRSRPLPISRSARASCSPGWASANASTTVRPSSPGASGSAPPWRAPSSSARASSCATSPPATSTLASARAVADLLFELHDREQTILVLVTHSGDLAARFADRRRLARRAPRARGLKRAVRLATLRSRSLPHFWRTNLAVVLGVATAVATLAGSLLVGESVRSSLARLRSGAPGRRRRSRWRLCPSSATISRAPSSGQPGFRELAGRGAPPGPHRLGRPRRERPARPGRARLRRRRALLLLPRPHGPRRSRGARRLPERSPGRRARGRGRRRLLLRASSPSEIPGSTLFGRRDEPGRNLRLRVAGRLVARADGRLLAARRASGTCGPSSFPSPPCSAPWASRAAATPCWFAVRWTRRPTDPGRGDAARRRRRPPRGSREALAGEPHPRRPGPAAAGPPVARRAGPRVEERPPGRRPGAPRPRDGSAAKSWRPFPSSSTWPTASR